MRQPDKPRSPAAVAAVAKADKAVAKADKAVAEAEAAYKAAVLKARRTEVADLRDRRMRR